MAPIVLGHRGAAGNVPENTLPAFGRGLDLGVDGFELDVHLTRDGEVVVCHDEKVDRTSNGTGWIKDLTLSEIKKLKCGAGFDEKAEIPTLREVLDFLCDKNLLVNIEIKNTIFKYEGIIDKVAWLLERYGKIETSIISSFDHESLASAKKKFPFIVTGLLYCCNMVSACAYASKLGASCLHPEWTVVGSTFVAECHANGIKVNTWTVDDRFAAGRVFEAKVDGIITNYPERFTGKAREPLAQV